MCAILQTGWPVGDTCTHAYNFVYILFIQTMFSYTYIYMYSCLRVYRQTCAYRNSQIFAYTCASMYKLHCSCTNSWTQMLRYIYIYIQRSIYIYIDRLQPRSRCQPGARCQKKRNNSQEGLFQSSTQHSVCLRSSLCIYICIYIFQFFWSTFLSMHYVCVYIRICTYI